VSAKPRVQTQSHQNEKKRCVCKPGMCTCGLSDSRISDQYHRIFISNKGTHCDLTDVLAQANLVPNTSLSLLTSHMCTFHFCFTSFTACVSMKLIRLQDLPQTAPSVQNAKQGSPSSKPGMSPRCFSNCSFLTLHLAYWLSTAYYQESSS
jgi:hypothetical protein